MYKSEVVEVVDRVFEHYLDCDITEGEKEEVEESLNIVKQFIRK